jgi:ubiquinone/menaquinone biosynthesis C-methylase UbiE
MRPVLDRHGVRHRLIGLDRSLPTCREATRLTRVDSDPGSARSDGPVFASADAFRLPFADRSFDLVHAALFLHHFREPDIGRLLGEMLRVARLGVLINDLHRNLLALYGIRALTALFSRSRYIRNDAPLSVRRGFRRAELMELWQRAGLPSPSIRWRWAFRWMLWTPAARAGVPPAQPEGASR